MTEQIIISAKHDYGDLDRYLCEMKVRCLLLVSGKSISLLKINEYFEVLEKRLGIKVVRFSDFQPNPSYESVVNGVEMFRRECCDAVFAVGGGSAMDVAKCIKLYATMNQNRNYLEQKIVPNHVKLFAYPTTAGTGSEATRYAVIYYQGEKQSITDGSCIPSLVVMDPSALETLSLYQKKVTMLDALCHAIESFWSVNSTDESRKYSKEAFRLVWKYKQSYLNNEKNANAKMLQAANTAGMAINITQTTAGHAMCYKLTSLYGIPHGYAAALCVEQLWFYMQEHMNNCIDPRGIGQIQMVFDDLSKLMGVAGGTNAAETFQKFMDELNLEPPNIKGVQEYELLKKSVNPVRLRNHPIQLDEETIDILYHRISRKD